MANGVHDLPGNDVKHFDARMQARSASECVRALHLVNRLTHSPALRAGVHDRDISKEQPDVLKRLKQQLLDLNASVMADAPDWNNNTQ